MSVRETISRSGCRDALPKSTANLSCSVPLLSPPRMCACLAYDSIYLIISWPDLENPRCRTANVFFICLLRRGTFSKQFPSGEYTVRMVKYCNIVKQPACYTVSLPGYSISPPQPNLSLAWRYTVTFICFVLRYEFIRHTARIAAGARPSRVGSGRVGPGS